MCESELTEFFAELTEFAAKLSEFSSPKQYSRNSIPPVSQKVSFWNCFGDYRCIQINYTYQIKNQSRFLGRGCDEALFSDKKGFFSEKGGGNSVNRGFGKDFYRKAIQ